MGDHGNMLATKVIMVQQPLIHQFHLDAASNLQHSPTCHIFPKRPADAKMSPSSLSACVTESHEGH